MAEYLTDTVAPLSLSNFRYVADFLQREAAITLEAGKEYLVETRLASLAARHNHASVNGLVEQLRAEPAFAASVGPAIVDALTTNETLFFGTSTRSTRCASTCCPSCSPPGRARRN